MPIIYKKAVKNIVQEDEELTELLERIIILLNDIKDDLEKSSKNTLDYSTISISLNLFLFFICFLFIQSYPDFSFYLLDTNMFLRFYFVNLYGQLENRSNRDSSNYWFDFYSSDIHSIHAFHPIHTYHFSNHPNSKKFGGTWL